MPLFDLYAQTVDARNALVAQLNAAHTREAKLAHRLERYKNRKAVRLLDRVGRLLRDR